MATTDPQTEAAAAQLSNEVREALKTALQEAFAQAQAAAEVVPPNAADEMKEAWRGALKDAFGATAGVIKESFGNAIKDAASGGGGAGKILTDGLSQGVIAGMQDLASKVGLGGVVEQVAAVGNQYKESLKAIQDQTKATDAQMAQVSVTAQQVGAALPGASAKDAAAAMAELAKSGFTVEQAMTAVNSTLQLAAATKVDATKAAGLQAQVLKAFGLEAGSAAISADVLASSARLMGVNVADVGSALVASGSGANKLGVSVADTAAAIAALTKAGSPVGAAGAMISAAFQGMVSDSAPAKQAIEQLGLTLTDANGKFVGMPTLFGQLNAAAKTMAPGMYEAATSALFGSDSMQLATLAAQQGVGAFDGITGAIGNQGAAADLAAGNTAKHLDALKSLEDVALRLRLALDSVTQSIAERMVAGLGMVKNAVSGIINFYREWNDVIQVLGAAIIGFFIPGLVRLAATTLYAKAVTLASAAAAKIMAAAQVLWNVATMGSPLGLIIAAIAAVVAGLVVFFTKTELGRRIWATVWDAIKSAIASAWEFIKPVWDGFLNAMKAVGDAVVWLWGTIIQPIFGLIGQLIQLWWNGYVMTVWSAFTAAIQLIGTVIEWLWSSVIQPVFGLIGEFISAWWNGVVKPMWDGFVAVIQFVGEAINWWWTSIVQPVFGLLGELISAVWNNIIKPMWDGFVASIQLVGDIFTWLWSSVVQPLLGFIGETISAVWNNIIKPIWDGFVAALQLVGSTFQAMWDSFIKPAWELLQAGIQAGWTVIQAAIETGQNIFNTLRDTVVGAINTILDYWNKIKDIVGTVVDTVGKIGSTVINGVTSVIPGFATGGHITGPGTGTSDSIVARLSDGEFVVNAKATSEHLGLLHAINSGSMSGSPDGGVFGDGGLPGFASGGLVSADQLVDFAKGVEGAVYNWGGVNWGDCSGAISALANYVAGLEPFASRFATANEGDALLARGFQVGTGPAGSLRIGWYNGGQFGGHTAATLPNGVNFEMGGQRGNGQYGGMASGANDPMFTDHAFFQFAAAQMAAPTGVEPAQSNPATTVPVTSTPVAATTDNRSPMDKRQASTFDSIQSNFTKAGTTFKNGMFGDFLNVFGIPDLDSTPLAKAATAWQKSSEQFSKDQASQAEWLKTNNTEAPAASTSIYWDSSRGPEQLLDLPGRLANALMGRISPTKYDNGGWLQPGLTLVENKTGQPEPVFNPQQWARMSDLTQGGSNDNSINIENVHTGMTADDFRREINLLQRERSLGFVGR
ncbi:phage tail tape measure protein [Nocardia sp. NPDC049149]|uniref:phage tail tape measure protein n=1 Tax=Nocardia sp. NPDC049149 TaxID=3364315 RepID=UPI003715A31D